MPTAVSHMCRFVRRSLCVLTLTTFAQAASAATFTYSGTLQDRGSAAEGRYDLELKLFASADSTLAIAGPVVLHGVQVHAGKFSTRVEFAGVADEAARGYIGVRVAASGTGALTPLAGREQISASNPTCPGAWDLSGNAGNPAGSFLGTVDAQPLVFEVNGLQAGAIEASSASDQPNVTFGSSSNTAVAGAIGAVVSGGYYNSAGSPIGWDTVGGGNSNIAQGGLSTVSGGSNNFAYGYQSSVSGGGANSADGQGSSISGGNDNEASGVKATVVGGSYNTAGGDLSLAAGQGATVRPPTDPNTCQNQQCGDYGTFVWADAATNNFFTSSGPNQFLIRATGGVAINGTPPTSSSELTVYGNGSGPSNNVDVDLFPQNATFGYSIAVTGSNQSDTNFFIEQTDAHTNYYPRVRIGPNGFIALNGASVTTNPLTVGTNSTTGNGAFLSPGGVWTNASSRQFKDGFSDIDAASILAKVVALPVQSWFYRDDHAEGRHLGPVAEDFMASFGLGQDETHIGSVDESGVAFAAIQGLNKKLEAENAEL